MLAPVASARSRLRVVDGLSDREIAERLALSPQTVREYVKRIYRKLDVNSRVALNRLLLDAPERDRGGDGTAISVR